jgi:hypothetical protein
LALAVPPAEPPPEDPTPELLVVEGRVVPAKDVVALEDMLLDALALDNTVALVVEVEPWDSAEVEATLVAADVVLTFPE